MSYGAPYMGSKNKIAKRIVELLPSEEETIITFGRNKIMNKNEIIEEIHKYIDGPFKEYMSAVKRCEEQPSVLNGSRKQDAQVELDNAIVSAAEHVFKKYHLSPEKFVEIVDEITPEV